MTRVIHTGDTHIGYRQYHSPQRRQDFLDAFEQVIDDAIEHSVDAIIHAGDLFHDSRPGLVDISDTVAILRKLQREEIPFLGIVGNHESTRDRQWLDLFEDLGLAVRLDANGTTVNDVTFYGMDYVPVSQREQLAYQFESPKTETTALVAHGLFEPFSHADWDTERVLEQSSVDFDALLLGDNHIPDQAKVKGTWVTYCGSTERASASEREQRGYNLITFDDNIRITRKQITGTRTFVFIEVELHGHDGTQRVIDEVVSHELSDAVVIIHVTGTGTEVVPARIEEVAKEAGALVVRLTDTRDQDDQSLASAQFSNPHDAVNERIHEMNLTSVGRMVDELIRDESIPEAGIRQRVRSRIDTLLRELPEAFERPRPISSEPSSSASAPSTKQNSSGNEDGAEDESTAGQTSIGEF